VEIKDIGPLTGAIGLPAEMGRPAEAEKGASFGDMLQKSLSEVNRLQKAAGESVGAYASGDKASLQDTMIALEQADVSFRLLMQVRNRIVEAYQEILRMQV
jgi:flagellar hook-basal body complex protein FliE